MKKVLLFPGTDALEKAENKFAAFCFPEVVQRIKEMEEIISRNFDDQIDLGKYMKSPNDTSSDGFRKMVFCSLATQVGLFDRYVAEHGYPDYVMGLSLGDVARSVVAGLVSFESGVKQLYRFVSYVPLVECGISVHLKLEETFDNLRDTLQLDLYGIKKSVIQNPCFGLIAGRSSDMQRWIHEVAKPASLNFRPMYPFPLHSELMYPAVAKLLPHITAVCDPERMNIRIISSVYGREIVSKTELISDCATNISATLDFPKAVNAVFDIVSNPCFVDMGPSNTLSKFITKLNLSHPYQLTHYFEESKSRVLMETT